MPMTLVFFVHISDMVLCYTILYLYSHYIDIRVSVCVFYERQVSYNRVVRLDGV